MNDYSKITALYSRLSVGDEDRDGGESNSIQNQKKFLESYAIQLKLDLCQYFGQKKSKDYAAFLSSSSSFCWGVK